MSVPAHMCEGACRGVLICGFRSTVGYKRFRCVSSNRLSIDEKNRLHIATGGDNHLHMWVGVHLSAREAGDDRRLKRQWKGVGTKQRSILILFPLLINSFCKAGILLCMTKNLFSKVMRL